MDLLKVLSSAAEQALATLDAAMPEPSQPIAMSMDMTVLAELEAVLAIPVGVLPKDYQDELICKSMTKLGYSC